MDVTSVSLGHPFNDRNNEYEAFEIYINDHRILTINTDDDRTANHWLRELLRTPRSKANPLIVGVAVDREYGGDRTDSSPYDLIQICTGSHCLFCHLEHYVDDFAPPRLLKTFFTEPNVIAVGVDMERVAKKLERLNGFVFGPKTQLLDINRLAVKALKRPELDLENYDLDKLAKVILGKWMVVDRSVEPIMYWYEGLHDEWLLPEKAELGTVDSYLCYMIGKKLLMPAVRPINANSGTTTGLVYHDFLKHAAAAASSSSKKKKKK